MAKPILFVLGAIPAIFAILIAVPLVTQTEIPVIAVNSDDVIEFEYTKHQLQTVSFGVTERLGAVQTEILTIDNDGKVRYQLIQDGAPQPDKKSTIKLENVTRITALVKETGFMKIPSESFPIRDGITEYQKSTLKITLNGEITQIHWPEQNVTEKFVPPIITAVERELDAVIKQIIE